MISSPIGGAFKTRPRIVGALALGLLATVVDFRMALRGEESLVVRAIPACAAIGLLLWIARGDWRTFGLRLHPIQGWRYWLTWAPIVAGGVAAISVCYLLLVPSMMDYVIGAGYFVRHVGIAHLIPFSCIQAPILEEAIYRLILCAPLAAAIRRTPTVLIDGAVFAALHFAYGNPGPDNFLAGFVLSWAYLESETILVPLVMHGGGNLAALCFQWAAASIVHYRIVH